MSATVTFRGSQRYEDREQIIAEVIFDDVLEFRWIEFDAGYEQYPEHDEDLAFGLIEIIDSAYVETMASYSRWRDYPGRRIRDQPESLVRHFRFGFDDWGSLDIIATKIAIRETGRAPEPLSQG